MTPVWIGMSFAADRFLSRCTNCPPPRLPPLNPLAISALGCRSPSGRLLCLSADRRRGKMVEVPNHVAFSG